MIKQYPPIPQSFRRTLWRPWRRFEPVMLTEMLDTVAAVNSQLLDALVDCARSDNLEFPLPGSLRGLVAQLTVAERQTVARCVCSWGCEFLWGIESRPGHCRSERHGTRDRARAALVARRAVPIAGTLRASSLLVPHPRESRRCKKASLARDEHCGRCRLSGTRGAGFGAYRTHLSRSGSASLAGSARRMDSPGGGRGRRGEPGFPINDAVLCLQVSAGSSAGLFAHLGPFPHDAALVGVFAPNTFVGCRAIGCTVSHIDSQGPHVSRNSL